MTGRVRPYQGGLRRAQARHQPLHPSRSRHSSSLLPQRPAPPPGRRDARRDAVVDRGRQQPDHADRGRLQRALGEQPGRARAPRSRSRPPSRLRRAAVRRARPRRPGAGRRTATAAAPAAPSSAPAPQGPYKVRAGDTLSGLAASSGVSLESMAAMNGVDPAAPLLDGNRAEAAQRRAAPPRASTPEPPRARRARSRPAADDGPPRRRRRPSVASPHGIPRRWRPRSPGRRAGSTTRWSPAPTRAASCR